MNQLKRTLKFAAVQLKVGSNKVENVARAIEKIREAKRVGGDSLELIVLPGNRDYTNSTEQTSL